MNNFHSLVVVLALVGFAFIASGAVAAPSRPSLKIRRLANTPHSIRVLLLRMYGVLFLAEHVIDGAEEL